MEDTMIKKILTYIWVVILLTAHLLCAGDQNKFQIELSGNYQFVRPKHLNYLVTSEMQYLSFCFDTVYGTPSTDGSLQVIKGTQTITTRLKYRINAWFGFSLGLSYLWTNQSSPYTVKYQRDQNWRTILDEIDYTTWKTKLDGFIPTIGIHCHLPLRKNLALELAVAGGPLFIAIDHKKEVTQALTSMSDQEFPIYHSERNLEMNGRGTGLSLTGSLKLQKNISRSIGISIESGYSWQQVKNIEGDGITSIDGYSTNYSGQWGLITELIETDWGSKELTFPTNNWAEFGQKSDDFTLDLSGFYISLGFYLSL
jgi:hypothetical protein